MFDGNVAYEQSRLYPFKPIYHRAREEYEDFFPGPAELNDPSSGLEAEEWQALLNGAGGVYFGRKRIGVSDMRFIASLPINSRRISGTTDANGQPVVTYENHIGVHLRWYDSTVPGFTTVSVSGARSPIGRMDDTRDGAELWRDIIFTYVRGDNKVCFRKSSDRFLTEYPLFDVHSWQRIEQAAMTINNRFQWRLVWDPDLMRAC